MPVKVDVKQFSANSPLDYADLNKLVTAIQTIAAAVPTTTTPAPAAGTGASPVKTGPTVLADQQLSVEGIEITKSNNSGKPTRIPFRRNGKNVTFAEIPLVVAMAAHKSGKGVAVVNISETTTTGFVAQVGWVGKAKGNVRIKYIAVGTEVASSDSSFEENKGSSGSEDSWYGSSFGDSAL